jgi:two-component system nitrate/nitrite response regulator NarL
VADLRVLIVADDGLARAGLAALLSTRALPGLPTCDVVDEVTSETWLEGATSAADVVLWDLGLDPVLHLEDLAELDPVSEPLVVLLPDGLHAVDVWTAGARGLLLRDADPGQLVAALAAVVEGSVVLDPDLAASLLPARVLDENHHLGAPTLVEDLTPRELEVLQLLAEGLSNRAIGKWLDISENTVKFHVNSILGKLGAQSRTEAVVRATRLGLIIL